MSEEWWVRAVFLDGVGPAAILAGMSALVARLTVHWTLKAAREDAKKERSIRAAFELSWIYVRGFSALVAAKPGERSILVHDLLSETTHYGVDLDDFELAIRLNTFTDLLDEFARWNAQVRPGAYGVVPREQSEQHRRVVALRDWFEWIGASLAAHRSGAPMPQNEPARPWPPLHDDSPAGA